MSEEFSGVYSAWAGHVKRHVDSLARCWSDWTAFQDDETFGRLCQYAATADSLYFVLWQLINRDLQERGLPAIEVAKLCHGLSQQISGLKALLSDLGEHERATHGRGFLWESLAEAQKRLDKQDAQVQHLLKMATERHILKVNPEDLPQ